MDEGCFGDSSPHSRSLVSTYHIYSRSPSPDTICRIAAAGPVALTESLASFGTGFAFSFAAAPHWPLATCSSGSIIRESARWSSWAMSLRSSCLTLLAKKTLLIFCAIVSGLLLFFAHIIFLRSFCADKSCCLTATTFTSLGFRFCSIEGSAGGSKSATLFFASAFSALAFLSAARVGLTTEGVVTCVFASFVASTISRCLPLTAAFAAFSVACEGRCSRMEQSA
mmetsp:Transcript_32818/g.47890  ORF Transcript_32818/g.47890 Transcript_32818/m.47890 type:complete len:225 (-) Transcript_32818:193-867(-)